MTNKLLVALEYRDDLECLADVLKSVWNSINDLVKLEEELVGYINPYLKNNMAADYNAAIVSRSDYEFSFG